MFKNLKKTVTALMCAGAMALTLIAPINTTPVYAEETLTEQTSQAEAFVERMYAVALNREPDEEGLNNWVSALINGRCSGADIAKSFILSEEFNNRNLTNEEFVTVLYRALFNREADAGGLNNWLYMLNAGFAKEFVLSNFVNGEEFSIVCNNYNIYKGIMYGNGEVPDINNIKFVERFFKFALHRNCDLDGLLSRTWEIHSNATTYKNMAISLMTADNINVDEDALEYTQWDNVSNKRFIQDLYKIFMGRKASDEEINHWKVCLDNGSVSRPWVIEQIAESEEFNILINSGNYQDVESLMSDVDICFFGDSITVGANTGNGFYSWSNYIEDNSNNYENVYNLGTGGWTISNTINIDGKVLCIQKIVNDHKDFDFDYVILSGGVNDMGFNVPMGTLGDDDSLSETFIGALENYICTAKQYWPNAKIGYIITYKPAPPTNATNQHLALENLNPYVNAMYQVFDEYDIPYLDLYNGSTSEGQTYYDLLGIAERKYMPDTNPDDDVDDILHITKDGYNVISPYILDWINSL